MVHTALAHSCYEQLYRQLRRLDFPAYLCMRNIPKLNKLLQYSLTTHLVEAVVAAALAPWV